MQALVLFTVAGMLLAVISSIISGAAQQRQAFDQANAQAVRAYFRNVEKVMQEDDVQRNMSVGSSTNCGGDIHTVAEVQPYLCRTNIAQLATWGGASSGRRDPWFNEFQGVVKTARVAMYAGSGNAFEVPVTVMALASPGPDRRFGATLEASMAALRNEVATTTVLRDIQRLETNPNEANGKDDILLVFSTRRAMEARWHRVNNAVVAIADAALRNYNEQFMAFQTGLDSYYLNNIGTFYDGSGNIVIGRPALENWRHNPSGIPAGVATRPAFNSVMFDSTPAGYEARAQLGVEEAFDLIEAQSRMRLSGTTTTNDQLVLDLNNNGSPWGNAAGYLNFRSTYSTQ